MLAAIAITNNNHQFYSDTHLCQHPSSKINMFLSCCKRYIVILIKYANDIASYVYLVKIIDCY